MKFDEEVMEILEAFDLTRSYRAAGRLAGCSHHTVAAYVDKRDKGRLRQRALRPRPSIIDPFRPKIEEWVDRSNGQIRADICQRRLKALGFGGSERTVRRAVAKAKQDFGRRNRRVFRPWITEPGMWAQFDWADGPRVTGQKSYLFCCWLAWSRFRFVIPVRNRRLETLISCLDRAMRAFGGVPTYWLTDNTRTVTSNFVARIPVRHKVMVAFAAHYGTTITTCEIADPQTKGGSEATVRIAKADLVPTDANLLSEYGSWEELGSACNDFLDRVNARIHRVTGRVPARQLAREIASLNRLPASAFTAAFGITRRVTRLALVSYRGSHYSVPHHLVDETVWVRVEGDELIVVEALPEGLEEVARHRFALPGRRVIDPGHYPKAPPGPLRRRPRATCDRERRFLAIGDNAERYLLAAAAAGTPQLGENLDEIVTLSTLAGSDAVNKALGDAADNRRFGDGDIASILAASDSSARYRADQARFLQGGTGSWQDFGTRSRER